MLDNILKSEVTEHISNRQTAKILFLQQELAQAHDQIKDLNYMLKLNKEALRLSIQEQEEGLPLSEIQNNKSNKENAINNYFIEENKRLSARVEELTKERNLAQSRALINRQIAEESENRLKEIESEFEEKIYELRRIIQDKEFTVQELEKVKPGSNKDGTIIKYREILNPNEQLMKLQQENAVLLNNLNKVSKKTHEIEERDKQLTQTNSILKKELIKIRSTLMSNINFAKIRSYIIDDNEAFSEGEEPIFVHEKLSFSKRVSEKCQAEKETIGKEKNTKKKLGSPLFQPHFPLKIENLENENRNLKDVTQKEFINNQLLLSELKNLKSLHETLLNTNETLIKSNRMLQEKSMRLSASLEFYRVYFYEYMDLLRQTGRFTRSSSLNPTQESKEYRRVHQDSIAMKYNEFTNKPNEKEEIKEVNVSILEEEKEKGKPKITVGNSKSKIGDLEQDEHENVNYRTFLLNLAKELYTNPNIRSFYSINKDILKKMEIQNFRLNDYKYIIRPKRSLSNPLSYISDSLKEKLAKPPLKTKKNRTSTNLRLKRMVSKGVSPPKNLGNGFGSAILPLFNLDVSKIANENLELSFDAKGNEEGFFLN